MTKLLVKEGSSENHLQGGVKRLEKELWSLGLGTAISDGVITFSDGHNLVIVAIRIGGDCGDRPMEGLANKDEIFLISALLTWE